MVLKGNSDFTLLSQGFYYENLLPRTSHGLPKTSWEVLGDPRRSQEVPGAELPTVVEASRQRPRSPTRAKDRMDGQGARASSGEAP